MILVDSGSRDACENFALEAYLAGERDLGDAALMLWQTEPTLMLGRYQDARLEIDLARAQAEGVAVVRRPSGGGTIYTDRGGWQFSVIDRAPDAGIRFDKYIAPVVEALRAMGVPAAFNGRNDLVAGGRKFSGNAQYRIAGAAVHHGSLLFSTDLSRMEALTTPPREKLRSKGIRSVRDRVVNLCQFMAPDMTAEAFGQELLLRLAAGCAHYALDDADRARVRAIASQRFSGWARVFGDAPPFELERTAKLAGGWATFRLDVRRGRIARCGVSGDFFATVGADAIDAALRGCPYREADVCDALVRAGLDGAIYRVGVAELARAIVPGNGAE